MVKQVNGITVELRGDLIIFKNDKGETFKAISVSPAQAVDKFNQYVKLLKDRK